MCREHVWNTGLRSGSVPSPGGLGDRAGLKEQLPGRCVRGARGCSGAAIADTCECKCGAPGVVGYFHFETAA